MKFNCLIIAKYRILIIVILIFVSSLQILILIFTKTNQDQKFDTQNKLLIYKFDESQGIDADEISKDKFVSNNEILEQIDSINSLFNDENDKSLQNIKSDIPVLINTNFTSTQSIFNVSKLQTIKIKPFNNSLKYIIKTKTFKSVNIKSKNDSLISNKLKKNKMKSNIPKNAIKSININTEESDMKQRSSIAKRQSIKKLKNKYIKVKETQNYTKIEDNSSLTLSKEAFIYNENDKYIHKFYSKYNYSDIQKMLTNYKFFDADEDKFAEEALVNNIANEDEELPLLNEVIPQNHINIQNLFTNNSVNVISMSLYGDQKRYTIGAVRNAELIKIYFPGWKLRIYMEHQSMPHHGKVPRLIIEKLKNLDAEIIYVDAEVRHMQPMMWRFLVADDPAVDNFLIRDCDSRLNERDAAATHAWLQTKAAFYCTRDHPSHAGYSISGGLWGGRTKQLKNILRHSWLDMMLSDRSSGRGGYFVDMAFLQNRIWKKVMNFAYCSDSVSCDNWTNAHPFPLRRRGYEHVGQVFDENENARPFDIRIMRHTGENKNCVHSNVLNTI